MTKLFVGILVGFAMATTVGLAAQAIDSRGMGGMMHGMMGEQKSGEDSSMQTMMRKMMAMMDRCDQMMDRMMQSHPDKPKEDPQN